MPADSTIVPFLLIDPLGSQRVSRYYYSIGRLPKGIFATDAPKAESGDKTHEYVCLAGMDLENTREGVTITLHGFLVADPTDNQNQTIDADAHDPVLWIVLTKEQPKTMLYVYETYAVDNYVLSFDTAEQITWMEQTIFTDATE